MTNNSAPAFSAVGGNGSGNATSSTGTGNAGQNALANTVTADQREAVSTSPEWVAGFCHDYGAAMLFAGQVFLYAALGLAIAIAAIEIYVAFKSATRPPAAKGDGNKNLRAVTPFPAVIEALKSLLTALSSAKIWLALAILGLLLLWMAATAPRLCMIGSDGSGTDRADATTNTAANASGNTSANVVAVNGASTNRATSTGARTQ